MADEAASIWGTGDGQDTTLAPAFSSAPVAATVGPDVDAEPAPRLFDDLGEADWGTPTPVPVRTTFSRAEEDDDAGAVAESLATTSIPATVSAVAFDDTKPEEVARPVSEAGSAGFDDFADAGEGQAEDEFGDFDDQVQDDAFDEEGGGEEGEGEKPAAMIAVSPVAKLSSQVASSVGWRPLELSPSMDTSTLAQDIRALLALPLADGRQYPFPDGAASRLSQDPIRQVEGPSQVLVREESRQVWDTLSQQPNLTPVDWMRSKTRRQYLIAVGVPINLDELNTTATNGAKALPPLALKLDNAPSSTMSRREQQHDDSPYGASPHGTAARDREGSKPPELDMARAKTLLGMTEDQLTLLTLPGLRDMQREVDNLTRQASGVLTHYLSQRETHAADAEMYNGLIRDLVTGAAKRVGASNAAGNTTSRKASMRKNHSTAAGSGRNSPAISTASGPTYSPRS